MTTVKEAAPAMRSVAVEVEVPGTPEEVWQAIATGPGITAWFVPTEVEEREGGEPSPTSARGRRWTPRGPSRCGTRPAGSSSKRRTGCRARRRSPPSTSSRPAAAASASCGW